MDLRWFKITVVGDRALVKGLIAGFLCGRGKDPEKGVLFCDDLKFSEDSFLHSLKEWIHLSKEMTHIIAGADQLDPIKEALRLTRPLLNCRLLSLQKIKEASFPFRFEIFSRKHGEKTKTFFNDVPVSIRIRWEEKDEIIAKNGRGIEVYSPLHEYTFKGKGTASGPAVEIVDLHKKMEGNELIQAGPLTLDLHPPEILEKP